MFFKLSVLFGVILSLICAAPSGSRRPADTITSPKRGDHVINNGVLSVYQDIIKRFLQTYVKDTNFDTIIKDLGTSGTLSHIYRDYNRPINDNEIVTNIQTGMVVDFTASENYKDTNAKPYGEAIEKLRQSAVSHMKELFDTRSGNIDTKKTKSTKDVRNAINDMISKELYVDQAAKTKYLKTGKPKENRQGKYDNANAAVRSMFESLYDKLKLWVKDIKTAMANSKSAHYKANTPAKKPAHGKRH